MVMSMLLVSGTDGQNTRDICLDFKTNRITCFINSATWKHRQKHMILSPSPVTDRKKKTVHIYKDTHWTQQTIYPNFQGEQIFESLVKPLQLLYAVKSRNKIHHLAVSNIAPSQFSAKAILQAGDEAIACILPSTTDSLPADLNTPYKEEVATAFHRFWRRELKEQWTPLHLIFLIRQRNRGKSTLQFHYVVS